MAARSLWAHIHAHAGSTRFCAYITPSPKDMAIKVCRTTIRLIRITVPHARIPGGGSMSPELDCRKDKSVDRMGSSGRWQRVATPQVKNRDETAGGRASGCHGAGDASAPAVLGYYVHR